MEIYSCDNEYFYGSVEEALGDLIDEPVGTIIPLYVSDEANEDVTSGLRLGVTVADALLDGVYEKFEASRSWCYKVEEDPIDTLEEKVCAAVREWLRENGRETELPIVCNGTDVHYVIITEDGWEWVE